MTDLIDRQMAIDTLDNLCDVECEYSKKQRSVMCGACHLGSAFDIIEELPPAQPERKTGKWVHGREIGREMIGDAITAIWYEGWQCSECKCTVEEEREPLWKFCPNCGAKMEKG